MMDKAARADRWKAFYQEDGGLGDMIAQVRNGYFERMATLDGDQVHKLHRLAIAAEATRQLDAMVSAIIAGGDLAAQQEAATRKLMEIPAPERDLRRRWMLR